MEFSPDQKKRVEACQEAIEGVLDNYKCALVPSLTIIQGRISHTVGILPQKEENRILVPKINKDKINLNGGK